MTLAQRIKACRSKAGLSQSELADRLVVDREAVQDWETGRGWPDIENLTKLAALFGVSTSDLLGKDGAVLGARTNRVAVDVQSLEKSGGRFLAKGTKAHTAVRQVFPDAVITPLLREKKNTKGESAARWFTEIVFDGVPNFFSEVKNSLSGDSFYLVEDASRPLLVRVTKDSVESSEIFGQLSRRKFFVGRNSFIKFGRPLAN
ncbi:helix-turn-helix domain-containing protein [uncultured Corynebacterium sp.]|uniref:helix-turn-helix transcriptional regulator n=1 Tax=uncultured Corynebacterium sp. TaxID=159447 RepID=UPI00288BB100|nr:helix-turn-helix domain-containing protein [uncultured Corynebacterium sp.]